MRNLPAGLNPPSTSELIRYVSEGSADAPGAPAAAESRERPHYARSSTRITTSGVTNLAQPPSVPVTGRVETLGILSVPHRVILIEARTYTCRDGGETRTGRSF